MTGDLRRLMSETGSSVLGEWFGEAYGEEGGADARGAAGGGGTGGRRGGAGDGGAAAAEDANGLRVARQVLGRGGRGGASPGLVAGGEEGAPRADHGGAVADGRTDTETCISSAGTRRRTRQRLRTSARRGGGFGASAAAGCGGEAYGRVALAGAGEQGRASSVRGRPQAGRRAPRARARPAERAQRLVLCVLGLDSRWMGARFFCSFFFCRNGSVVDLRIRPRGLTRMASCVTSV